MKSNELHDEACKFAVSYERSKMRKAEDVSHEGIGYDVVGSRYIDVKTCTHSFKTEDFRIFWPNLKRLVRKNGWIYCFMYDEGETEMFYEIPLTQLNSQIDKIEHDIDEVFTKVNNIKTQNIEPKFYVRVKFSAKEKQGFQKIFFK